jgi:hypothetical protein
MPLTAQQEEVFSLAMSHSATVSQVRGLLFGLAGRFPGGPPPFPGSGATASLAVPTSSDTSLSYKLYAEIVAFARALAESFFIFPMPWVDFEDGWRVRFAERVCQAAEAWGTLYQIDVTAGELVATGLIGQTARDPDHLRFLLLGFAGHFVQALCMYSLGHDPALLSMTKEEADAVGAMQIRMVFPPLSEA